MALYGEARRAFRRQDGSIFLFEDEDEDSHEVRRHRAQPQSWGEITLDRVGRWIRATQKRTDMALAVVCFFLVLGAVFLGFGGGAYLFFSDPSVGWTFWTLGFGMWLVSMTMFFSFMDWPLPRHSRVR